MITPSAQQINDLCRKYNVNLLVLFGSQAAPAKAKPRDIDIAVQFGRRPSAREELDFFYDSVRLFATDKLDLVVLDKADPVLLKEVALYGLLLFEKRKDAFDQFIMNAVAKYQDTVANRRLAAKLVDQFLSERKRGA